MIGHPGTNVNMCFLWIKYVMLFYIKYLFVFVFVFVFVLVLVFVFA